MDDLEGAGLLELVRASDRYTGTPEHLRPYLIQRIRWAIWKSVCKDWKHKTLFPLAEGHEAQTESPDMNPEELASVGQVQAKVRKMVKGLRRSERRAICMRYYQGQALGNGRTNHLTALRELRKYLAA